MADAFLLNANDLPTTETLASARRFFGFKAAFRKLLTEVVAAQTRDGADFSSYRFPPL